MIPPSFRSGRLRAAFVQTPSGSTRGRRRALVVGAVICVLVLTSCGQGGRHGERATIEEALGVDLTNTQAFASEMERERNEMVAACMQEQGFQWQPDPKIETIYTRPDDGLTYGTKAWVQKYGFGTSTRHFPQSELSGGVLGYAGEPDLESWESPNQIYFDSLQPLEREAYTEALDGPTACYSTSLAAVRADSVLGAIGETFGGELRALQQRASADPRVLNYDAEVSRCVRENGVEFASPVEFDDYVFGQLSELEVSDSSGESSLGADGVPDRSSAQARSALSQKGLDDLAKIQAEEVAIALQFFECGRSPERDELFDEVWSEYESDFVNDNRAELDELSKRLAAE